MKIITTLLCLLAFVGACSKKIVELKSFPLDSIGEVIIQPGLEIDKETTTDKKGSLKITSIMPTTIRLFETGDVDIENATLIYQAKVRTQDVTGPVYLEMWCHFPGMGEYFSRGLNQQLQGSTYWTTLETPFFLKKGENPDNVRLNLVIDGKGMVWVDEVKLLKAPL